MQVKNPDVNYCKKCGRRLVLNNEYSSDFAGGALNGLCITCENETLREMYSQKMVELSKTRQSLIEERKRNLG